MRRRSAVLRQRDTPPQEPAMRLTLRLAFALCWAAPAALAQPRPADPAPDGGLGEIVVTAERRAANLQTTPVSVTALGEEQLAAQNVEQTLDLAKTVPNLQLLPLTASPSSFQVALRGGVEQAGAIVTSEPAVAIYVDDVYRGRVAGSNFELTDIERVEVLRGPQGTLYGRNAFSGAIKFITKTPGRDPWASAFAGYGSYDEWRVGGSLGGPIADKVGASLSAIVRDRGEGYIDNLALGRKVGREATLAVRGKLALIDADPLEAVLGVTYTRDRNDGYSAIPVSFPNPSARPLRTRDAIPVFGCKTCNASPTRPRGENEQFATSLNVAHDLGAATIRSITAYVKTDDLFRWDLSGGTRRPDGTFAAGFERTADASSKQVSQELQALGDLADGRLEWIVGLYFYRERSTQMFNDVFNGFPLLPTFLDTTTRSFAGFAQGTFGLTDRLGVTAGVRWTRDRKELDGSIQSGFAPPVRLVAVSLDNDFEAWTPRFGVDFRATDTLFLFGSLSRGFKAGGYNGLAVANPTVLASVYGPQTIWAYEFGAKWEGFDRRLRANLAVFRNELKNLQQTANIAPFSFATQNVGDARLNGVELELTAVPVDGLTLFGNVGFMDDKYRRLSPASDAAANNATRLPVVSRWSWQGGFAYASPEPLGRVARLKFGADYKNFSDYFATTNNIVEITGFGRLDAFVAIATADDRWEARISAKNLTDERDFGSAAQTIALTPNEPRRVMGTISWRM
jgi:iron complex outermembrane receptor protein